MIKFFIIALIAISFWIVIEIIEKIFIKSVAERSVKEMLADYLADCKEGKTDPVSLEDSKFGTIEIVKDGFHLQMYQNGEKNTIEWDEVSDIFAYKKDLGTTDMICLGWKLFRHDEMIETHEEMLGFSKLCDTMVDKFKKISISWYMDVAFPAFETNLTRLWSKNEKNE